MLRCRFTTIAKWRIFANPLTSNLVLIPPGVRYKIEPFNLLLGKFDSRGEAITKIDKMLDEKKSGEVFAAAFEKPDEE